MCVARLDVGLDGDRSANREEVLENPSGLGARDALSELRCVNKEKPDAPGAAALHRVAVRDPAYAAADGVANGRARLNRNSVRICVTCCDIARGDRKRQDRRAGRTQAQSWLVQ